MNFAELMTFWNMKGIQTKENCLYEKPIYGTDKHHAILHLTVTVSSMVAHIIYKSENGKVALVNADIMFKSYGDKDDELFIKNAKLYQLAEHMS